MTPCICRWMLTLPLLVACAAAVATQPLETQQQAATSALMATRGSADPRAYLRAEQEVARLASALPQSARALGFQSWLEISRHRFAAALQLAERALAADADEPLALALRVDALAELGRYDEAVDAAQRLALHASPVVAYPRAAHLRFLNGDLEGAIEIAGHALQRVPDKHGERGWLTADLADLLIEDGRAPAAVDLLRGLPLTTAQAHAWLARALLAAGDSVGARDQWLAAHAMTPMPEYALALWKLACDSGEARQCTRFARLLAGQARLDAVQGGLSNRVFIEFHGLNGNLPAAYELARAEWCRRPDIFSAAQLAWVLQRMGHASEAGTLRHFAVRLGTRSRELDRWLNADASAAPPERPANRPGQVAQ